MLTLLAQVQDDSVKKIFGGGIKDAPLSSGTVSENFSHVFGFAITFVIGLASLYVLVMVIWGTFDWISSEGTAEGLKKARGKIVSALVGLFILILVLVIWFFVGTNILGTITGDRGVFNLKLPTVGGEKPQEETPPLQDNSRTPGSPPLPE